jgi:hypothetical protein
VNCLKVCKQREIYIYSRIDETATTAATERQEGPSKSQVPPLFNEYGKESLFAGQAQKKAQLEQQAPPA